MIKEKCEHASTNIINLHKKARIYSFLSCLFVGIAAFFFGIDIYIFGFEWVIFPILVSSLESALHNGIYSSVILSLFFANRSLHKTLESSNLTLAFVAASSLLPKNNKGTKIIV